MFEINTKKIKKNKKKVLTLNITYVILSLSSAKVLVYIGNLFIIDLVLMFSVYILPVQCSKTSRACQLRKAPNGTEEK